MTTEINLEDNANILNLENDKNIFSNVEYIIPLYQRAYAWEDKEIIQLIEDIYDFTGDTYYIGSLIVSEIVKNEKYEVIDGQQRLTTLYLLLNCLGIEVTSGLSFACRKKSNYTLKNINKIDKLDENSLEPAIIYGFRIIGTELKKRKKENENFLDEFKKRLEKVILFRIEVPKHTDLNHYFEIMNTRGEQLEQHDILKAKLMSYLQPNDNTENSLKKQQNAFAKIWEACSDMSGYVQMHFNPAERNALFDEIWENIRSVTSDNYAKAFYPDSTNNTDQENTESTNESNAINEDEAEITESKFTINDILNNTAILSDTNDNVSDNDKHVRFESIIEFPYFLLHTLNVYTNSNNSLDDKKLNDIFDNVLANVRIGENTVEIVKNNFAKGFIICLLKTRLLFDKYIIKRDYSEDTVDGKWSLKQLQTQGNNNAKYTNTITDGETQTNKSNIMIQSALRVSYTSPKSMHWITELLIWLSDLRDIEDITSFNEVTENIAKNAVQKGFIEKCNDKYEMGVATPHIVFNYLDYLLWSENQEKKGTQEYKQDYEKFDFEFRNSVEHWYPQNPSDSSFEKWDENNENNENVIGTVDRFGNLCLIHRSANSKFSNLSPYSKADTYKDTVDKGSLKLRLMSEMTKAREGNDETSSKNWKTEACVDHEKAMIKLLKENVYSN